MFCVWIPLCNCRDHRISVKKSKQNSEDLKLKYINAVGDEFHYVLKCDLFAEQKMLLLGKPVLTHPSIFTFNNVMNVSGTKLLKLSKLTQIIVKNVNR